MLIHVVSTSCCILCAVKNLKNYRHWTWDVCDWKVPLRWWAFVSSNHCHFYAVSCRYSVSVDSIPTHNNSDWAHMAPLLWISSTFLFQEKMQVKFHRFASFACFVTPCSSRHKYDEYTLTPLEIPELVACVHRFRTHPAVDTSTLKIKPFPAAFLSCSFHPIKTVVTILPTQTMHYYKGNPSKSPCICIKLHPKNGSHFMITVKKQNICVKKLLKPKFSQRFFNPKVCFQKQMKPSTNWILSSPKVSGSHF